MIHRTHAALVAGTLTSLATLCIGVRLATVSAQPTASDAGIHKIRHVVVIMQENRSFDHYFGTFPGADGLPMRDGVPTTCLAGPTVQGCARPYLDHQDRNGGAAHSAAAAARAIDGGKMDGFVAVAAAARSPAAMRRTRTAEKMRTAARTA